MKILLAVIGAIIIWFFLILLGWVLGWNKYESHPKNSDRFYED